ncbi:MAG: phenylacetate--CoA ligase family protein, partial [Pseudomonadota bacterium]
RALVSGETFFDAKRAFLENRFGLQAFECYATSDTGLIGYESEARAGLLVDESLIVELVEPGGTRPVGHGEIGEVVVTAFNPDYPLIRYATGDLSSLLHGESPCGRTNMRLAGWSGRVAELTEYRGIKLQPRAVIEAANRHDLVGPLCLFVTRAGLSFEYEAPEVNPDIEPRIEATLRALAGLSSETDLVVRNRPAGELDGNAKLIEDQREAE